MKVVICALLLLEVSSAYSINDEYWKYMWYLNPAARGQYGVHLRVTSPWNQGYRGAGVTVSVVDSGINDAHPDLRNRVTRRKDFRSYWDRQAGFSSDGHGTYSAGVLAAQPNAQCGVGVAPESKLLDAPIFGQTVASDDRKAQALMVGIQSGEVDISCNAWGTFDGGATVADMPKSVRDALKDGTSKGRWGKGIIYVWASGNGGKNSDSCAYDPYINSRYTLAVSGVNAQGNPLATSEACSAVIGSAPSRDTDAGFMQQPIITSRSPRGCTYRFSDSSVAAPLAAGVIALVLQANQALGWRDVQHIIAKTSNPCIGDQSKYKRNAAGFKVSRYHGFGLINAEEAVKAAKSWSPVGNEEICSVTVNLDAGQTSAVINAADLQCSARIMSLENIVASVSAAGRMRGAIELELSSPSGTTLNLLPGRWQDYIPLGLSDHQVKAVGFWGEPGMGQWRLRFDGLLSDKPAQVYLKLYGLKQKLDYGQKQMCYKPSSTPNNNNVPALSQCTPYRPNGECYWGRRSMVRDCYSENDLSVRQQDYKQEACVDTRTTTTQRWNRSTPDSNACDSYDYGGWSQCSVSCGQGTRTRRRFCVKNGGRKRLDKQTEQCQMAACDDCKIEPFGACTRISGMCGQYVYKTCKDGKFVTINPCQGC